MRIPTNKPKKDTKKETYLYLPTYPKHALTADPHHITPTIKKRILCPSTFARRLFIVTAAACPRHNANDVALASPIRQEMHLRFPGLATIVPGATVSD